MTAKVNLIGAPLTIKSLTNMEMTHFCVLPNDMIDALFDALFDTTIPCHEAFLSGFRDLARMTSTCKALRLDLPVYVARRAIAEGVLSLHKGSSNDFPSERSQEMLFDRDQFPDLYMFGNSISLRSCTIKARSTCDMVVRFKFGDHESSQYYDQWSRELSHSNCVMFGYYARPQDNLLAESFLTFATRFIEALYPSQELEGALEMPFLAEDANQ